MDSLPKVFKRAVTSIEYKWFPGPGNLADHTTYDSPVFPSDPTQAATVNWRLKLKTYEQLGCVDIWLFASSRHITSIGLSFDFTIQHTGLIFTKAQCFNTYTFEATPGKANWIKIGGWSEIHPHDKKGCKQPLHWVYCTINILDEEKQVSNGSLFYTIPSDDSWRSFEALLTTGKDADVTLVSKDSVRKINAHKLILKARSAVFDAMFSNTMSESINNLVMMDDVDGDVLDALVQFIYTGRVSKLSTTADRLLMVADRYDLPKLRAICEQQIGLNLSVDNAVETLVLADMHRASQLRKHTLSFISHNSQKVVATGGWQEFKVKYPSLLIDVCESIATKPQ